MKQELKPEIKQDVKQEIKKAEKPKKMPGCPYEKKCGGCSFHGQSYKNYLLEREEELNELLQDYTDSLYEPTIHLLGMKEPFHYRHKVTSSFDHIKGGKLISGVYEKRSHKVVNIDSCMIQDERADSIIRDLRKLCESFKIKAYDEDTGFGLLRHVMIRTGYHSDEIMVILVISNPIFPSKKNFSEALRKLHPEITTIVLNVNERTDSMVLGPRNIVLYGPGKIVDSLLGFRYDISPQSFFQVNPEMTEKIYRTALDFAKLKKTDVVLDAYCGIGTIGISAAGSVSKVYGVEMNALAIEDAIGNAHKNGIRNITFARDDAGEFLERSAEMNEHIDVLFMDPPRQGSSEQFLQAAAKMKPDRIVYISCNPETLERDLEFLTMNAGYGVKKMMAFDQFPWTEHTEVVTGLKYLG